LSGEDKEIVLGVWGILFGVRGFKRHE